MKTFFVDCETTGDTAKVHGLIQVSGVIFEGKTKKSVVDMRMAPFDGCEITDEALEINGTTREEIAAYPDPHQQFQEFQKTLATVVDRYNKADKMHFIGWNADFDADFVRAWFEREEDPYFGSWFWWPIIDVAKLAGMRLMHERSALQDFKLFTVAEYLGVQTDDGDQHDAMFDIKVTMRIFKKLVRELPWFAQLRAS